MATFGIGTYPTIISSGTVVTNTTGWTTTASANYIVPLPTRPVGKPLPDPPMPGIWIQEDCRGSKKRQITEVRCGNCIVVKGKRHSLIAWKNLGRYLEVDPP